METKTHLRITAWLGVLLIVLLAGSATASAALPLWRVEGEGARVYLLGSVHLLREQDFPLAPGIEQAYEEADRLLLELDLDDIDPLESQMLIGQLGRLEEGGLAAWMGEDDYARARELAAAIDIDLDMLGAVKPWLAAITVLQLQLGNLGFSPELGIDIHFASRAAAEGKPVEGFETLAYQLGLFDGLSRKQQSDFLLQSLTEAADIADEADAMIAAWRSGDAAALATILEEGFATYPALYSRLVVERNRNWVPRIVKALEGEGTVLVIVGALHLVGGESVIEMLAQRGYRVEQLGQDLPPRLRARTDP